MRYLGEQFAYGVPVVVCLCLLELVLQAAYLFVDHGVFYLQEQLLRHLGEYIGIGRGLDFLLDVF